MGLAVAQIGAEITAIREVEAREGEASIDELSQSLRAGALGLDDLVESGTGWTTFEHSMEFQEVCEPLVARRKWLRRLKLSVAVLLGMALVAGAVGLKLASIR